MKQLLVTMRGDASAADARAGAIMGVQDILQSFGATLIGAPGFSMRIAVAPDYERALRAKLESRFIVEDDYTLHTFGAKAVKTIGRKTARLGRQPHRQSR